MKAFNEKNRVAIVIPVYKETLNEFETISFKRCLEVFSNYRIILAAPQGLNLRNYYQFSMKVSDVRFEDKNFTSIPSYNKMMMSSFFYKKFLGHEYILIYQLDAFVFENSLEVWCEKGYDYIGAPWVDGEWIVKLKNKLKFPVDRIINKVGNGGISLRKVKTFYNGAKYFRPIAFFWIYNEDFFWSTFVYRFWPSFRIPEWKEALSFAFEDNPSKAYEINQGHLPFACHAWEKYDLEFWKPFFLKEGYRI